MKINFSILNEVTANHNNCPEILRITGQTAPFFLVKRGNFSCCYWQNSLYLLYENRYQSKNIGEIDFLIKKNNKIIPLEVKSGGDYKKHTSLNKLLVSTYSINLTTPYVLSTNNLEVKNEITYLPIYMLGFLKKEDEYNYIAKLEI